MRALAAIVVTLAISPMYVSAGPDEGPEWHYVIDTLDDHDEGARGLMVPLVELDTNTYEKKLWFGESVLLVPPDMESRQQVVAAIGPVVVVAFRYHATISKDDRATEDRLMVSHSSDFGVTWSPLQMLNTPSGNISPHPTLCPVGNRILLCYDGDQSPQGRVVWCRSFDVVSLQWSAPVLVDSEAQAGISVHEPLLFASGDTAYVAYDALGTWFKRSLDGGATWNVTGTPASTGYKVRLLDVDTVFALVYSHDLQAYVSRSFDGLFTWNDADRISPSDDASQGPAAGSDGKSDIHVCWYDFEGIEIGCGGFPYYVRSQDLGETWDESRSFSEYSCAERLDICAEGDYVYAVWNWSSNEGSPHFSLNIRCSRDRGDSWTETIVFEDTYKAWECDVYAEGDYIYMTWWEQHPPDWIRNLYFRLGAWYTPGDVDMSGEIDIADLIYMVTYMFQNGPVPWVMGAIEMDGQDGLNIADLIYLVMYMFQNGPAPIGAPEP